jgi:hypothetical protein
VTLDDDEFQTIQRIARRDGLTTAEWVRRRLREGATASGLPDTAARLAAIHRAYRYQTEGPAPEINQMLDEIERGYRSEIPTS